MKRIFKCFAAMSLGLALTVAGCSSDGDGENYAGVIAGTYVGELSLDGGIIISNDSEIIVERMANDKVTLKLDEALVVPIPGSDPPVMIDFPITANCGARVEKATGDLPYLVSGTTSIPLPAELTGGLSVSTPVGIQGEFSDSGKAKIKIIVSMPTAGSIDVIFIGEKQN